MTMTTHSHKTWTDEGVTSVPLPGRAQQAAGGQGNDQQQRQEFTVGFLKGCVAGKTPGVSNQQQYCTCLAKAYNARYDGRTLNLISELAGQSGKPGPILVDVMMAPERQSCVSRRS